MMNAAMAADLDLPGDPYFYLRSAPGDVARKLLSVYDALSDFHRKHLPIEAFCVAANVDPNDVADLLAESISKIQRRMVTVKFSASHATVADATIVNALKADGVRDRAIVHKIMGALPVPKGSSTIVNVQQNSSSRGTAMQAPPPERTIQRLSERLAAARPAITIRSTAPEPADDDEPDDD